jgi:outer membrane murein-binding lipoprotein Lpp
MALNFGVLQPVNIGGQILAGQQEAQRNQLAQQQLRTGEMQLEQAMREREALDKMQKAFIANGKSGDLSANFTEMMNSGIPHFVDIGVKGLQTLKNQQNFEALLKGGAAPAPAATPAAAPGALGSGTFDSNVAPVRPPTPITETPLPTNQLAPATAAPAAPAAVNQLSPDVTNLRRQIDAAYSLGTPQALAWAQAREKELGELTKPQVVAEGSSVYIPGRGFVATATQKTPTPPAMVAEYEYAKTPAGGGFTGSYQQFVTARAAAGRAPAQPPQPQPPVAVVDPVTGKQVYVTREQALSGKMTPASAMEGLAPKEIQAREAKFPAATSAIKTFESSADRLAADLEKLAKHPGLSGISGLVYGRTPAVTKDARAAQALYDSIVARGGFQELQNMRSASPTGGALGNVSNQEGQYLRDAFAPINRTQDTADLSRALTEAAGATRSSKQRLREAYDMTYDYKNQGGAVAPAAGGKVVDFGSLK